MVEYRWLKREYALVTAVIAALAAAPTISQANPNFLFIILILFWTLLYAALATSWNIIGGYAGQISFGHSAFYGVGAYVVTLLLTDGFSLAIALPLAGVFAVALSLLIGYPTFRLRGPFFSIATIGVGEIMRIIGDNVEEIFRGGSSGLLVPTPRGWEVEGAYYLALSLAVASLLISYLIRRSNFGLRLFSIKDDEEAAETIGINATSHKLFALAISAFLVGLCGAAVALRTAYIYPDDIFGLGISVVMILMPLIGGLGTIWGPVLGAIIFTILDQLVSVALPSLKLLLFGCMIVAILLFEPNGLVGLARRFTAAQPQRLNRRW